MIYAVWSNTTGAGYAMQNMSKSARDLVEASTVLIKQEWPRGGKAEAE
jgi:hypothetical protein